MKLIPLTQEQEAIVDDHWYDYLMQWKWQASWRKNTQSFYAVRTEYLPRRKTILMHRVVANTPDGMECDHIFHITLDNRESELRNVTLSQNKMNKRIRKDNTTGTAGVWVRSKTGKYVARIRLQGKVIFYKEFKTFEEAAQARKEAERKYFGEYANG